MNKSVYRFRCSECKELFFTLEKATIRAAHASKNVYCSKECSLNVYRDPTPLLKVSDVELHKLALALSGLHTAAWGYSLPRVAADIQRARKKVNDLLVQRQRTQTLP